MNATDKEICLDCGAAIPNVCIVKQFGPFVLNDRRIRCDRCAYWQFYRSETCCRCPFKSPMPRMKRDGSLPDIFQRHIDEAMQA